MEHDFLISELVHCGLQRYSIHQLRSSHHQPQHPVSASGQWGCIWSYSRQHLIDAPYNTAPATTFFTTAVPATPTLPPPSYHCACTPLLSPPCLKPQDYFAFIPTLSLALSTLLLTSILPTCFHYFSLLTTAAKSASRLAATVSTMLWCLLPLNQYIHLCSSPLQ